MKPRGTQARYGTEEFRQIAEQGLILRCEVGSGVHGIAIEGTDDRDVMGICVEPARYVIGLREFEQYVHRTAWQRLVDAAMGRAAVSLADLGEQERSRPGDTDLVIYSLRKWMRLALNGNPSVLLPLFAPLGDPGRGDIDYADVLGTELRRAGPEAIISRRAGYRFLGYLHAQREEMLGLRSPDVHRPELVEEHGYDTKFAAHAVRLGYQGIELMATGRLTLPIPYDERKVVREIKMGKFGDLDDVLALIADVSAELEMAIQSSGLRPDPDRDWADKFLIWAYLESW